MQRLVHILIATILLSAQAWGQTSAEATRSNPQKAYLSLKKSFVAVPRMYLDRSSVHLTSCVGPEEAFSVDMGPDKKYAFTRVLTAIAFDMLFIEGNLKKAGYPEDVWRDELTNMETNLVAKARPSDDSTIRALDPSYKTLALKLNSYRVSHKSLSPVRVEPPEGCGAVVGPPVDIDTTPKAQRIQYISQHFAALCSDQGLDFKDEKNCSYWFDYSRNMQLLGKYIFAVRWSGNSVTYPKFNLDTLKPRDDGHIHVEILQ